MTTSSECHVAALIAVAWSQGWTQPLYVAAYIRQLGGDSYAESRVWIGTTAQYLMQHSLEAAGLRVCLVGLSGFTVWLLLWGMLLLRLGSHSLVGWCFAAAWGLAEALVWRPRHALQVSLKCSTFHQSQNKAISVWVQVHT